MQQPATVITTTIAVNAHDRRLRYFEILHITTDTRIITIITSMYNNW